MIDGKSSGARITVTDVAHRYAAVRALGGVSMDIAAGSFTAILGPNGAGKSTLAQILCGTLQPSAGSIAVDGQPVRPSSGTFIRHGIVLVPEGRRLFGQLSCRENLVLGAYGTGCAAAQTQRRLAATLELMPASVQNGQERAAATFSGGEQQMLALGRAMMAGPRAIVIDEPSLGLAPILIEKVYDLLAGLHRSGVTVIVVEQLAAYAMRHAGFTALLDRGLVKYSGASDAIAAEALGAAFQPSRSSSPPQTPTSRSITCRTND